MTLFCVSVDGGEMFTLLGATYPADERKKKKKEKRVLMFIQTNAFYCLYLLSSPILRIIRAYLYEEQNHLSNANYLDYLMTISVIFKASNSVRASCRSEVVKVCTRGSSLGS